MEMNFLWNLRFFRDSRLQSRNIEAKKGQMRTTMSMKILVSVVSQATNDDYSCQFAR